MWGSQTADCEPGWIQTVRKIVRMTHITLTAVAAAAVAAVAAVWMWERQR